MHSLTGSDDDQEYRATDIHTVVDRTTVMTAHVDVNRKNIKIDRWHDILLNFELSFLSTHDIHIVIVNGQIKIEIIRSELRRITLRV